jgi:selenocysteine-specific elongation factor
MLRSPVAGAVVAAMIDQRRLKLADGTVALPNFSPAVEQNAPLLAKVIETLEKAGLTPPSVPELEADLGQPGLLPLLRQAAQQQRIVAVESDRYFAPGSLEQFLSAVRQLAATQEITPAGLREILGLSRKYLIPLLEWSDRTGVTRRVGDARVLV